MPECNIESSEHNVCDCSLQRSVSVMFSEREVWAEL